MKVRWTPGQLARAGSLVVASLTILVSIRLFLAIDGQSHSVSDTLLGFVPNDLLLWAVALALIWLLRRSAGRTGR